MPLCLQGFVVNKQLTKERVLSSFNGRHIYCLWLTRSLQVLLMWHNFGSNGGCVTRNGHSEKSKHFMSLSMDKSYVGVLTSGNPLEEWKDTLSFLFSHRVKWWKSKAGESHFFLLPHREYISNNINLEKMRAKWCSNLTFWWYHLSPR